MLQEDFEVVLTPQKSAKPGGHVMRIERVPLSHLNKANVQHIAGGPYKGIIINKASEGARPLPGNADTSRSFTAYVADQRKGANAADFKRERRTLQFWFEDLAKVNATVIKAITETYMKELLNPELFPKDYITFVKRVLTLVQQYGALCIVELSMVPLTDEDEDDDVVFKKTPIAAPSQTTEELTATTTSKNAHVHVPTVSPAKQEVAEESKTTTTKAAVEESAVTTTVTTTTRTAVGTGQEDYKRLADGTLVDSHGNIVREDNRSMQMNGGRTMERSYNDSISPPERSNNDNISPLERTNNDSRSPLERSTTSQDDYLSQESFDRTDVSFDGTFGCPRDTSTVKREVKRQPTITRKGWDVVWATKKQKLLNILEDAYPNVLSVDDLVRVSYQTPADVEYLMGDLQIKGLIKEIGQKRWIRMPQERKLVIRKQRNSRSSRTSMDLSMDEEANRKKHDFKMVSHVPRLPEKEQPTVAIITLLYCEKLAVDAMMDFKTTYIRVKKTEGDGLVYTVGMIGGHRVVATKLPRIGHGQGATVSAGSNITRLLGTFGRIEHVLLVGVGGGVANLKNESRHVKLGDIVASKSSSGEPAYIHCKDVDINEEGFPRFITQTWRPEESLLNDIIIELHEDYRNNTFFGGDWEKYVQEAELDLQSGEMHFSRPPPESDKLYKVHGDDEVEIDHPTSPLGSARDSYPNRPVIHLGSTGTGKQLTKDDKMRQDFAVTQDVMCMDSGFHAVMDSIEGNRKDSFAIIRGISDYQDGAQRREWQAYASLNAAAFMKSILMRIPCDDDSDDD